MTFSTYLFAFQRQSIDSSPCLALVAAMDQKLLLTSPIPEFDLICLRLFRVKTLDLQG